MPALRNPRQERFVQELIKGKSAREAYRLAGYKDDKGHGCRLRSRPAVAQRYDELITAAAARAEVTATAVMNELAAIAFANIADFVTIDADGTPRPDLARLTRAQMAALADARYDEYTVGRGEAARKVRRMRIKLADKHAALVNLGRMLGLFRDRVEVSGRDGTPIETRQMSDVEVARRIAFVLAKAAVGAARQEGATDAGNQR